MGRCSPEHGPSRPPTILTVLTQTQAFVWATGVKTMAIQVGPAGLDSGGMQLHCGIFLTRLWREFEIARPARLSVFLT
jgi:hypothetical protein